MELSEARKYADAQRKVFFAILEQGVFQAISSWPAGIVILNIPVLGDLVKFCLSNILKKVSEQEKLFVWFQFVDFRVTEQFNEHTRASQEYALALEKGDKNEIEKARIKAINAFDNFAKYIKL